MPYSIQKNPKIPNNTPKPQNPMAFTFFEIDKNNLKLSSPSVYWL